MKGDGKADTGGMKVKKVEDTPDQKIRKEEDIKMNLETTKTVFDPELEQSLKRTFELEGLTSQQISYMRTKLFQIGCLTMNDLNLLSEDTIHNIFCTHLFPRTEICTRRESKTGTP